MRMKRGYFRSIRPQLLAQIDARAEKRSSFREEMFDKLHTFFSRYFCESGSIYFRHLPAFSRVYERVYADGEDVALAWKTRMLYYVKSDVLVRSMPVELNEEGKPQNTRRFYFDASTIEHKKNNERREFVFTFDEVKQEQNGRVVRLKVAYSSGGVRTKTDDIIKQSRKGGVKITDEQLHKAVGAFRRQTEADFFINKDARGFLREQFDLWVYQYLFHGITVFEEERIRQIQAIRDTACDIIDFIAQFEDELRGAWEKPKFVRGVNYVVTLDKLTDATLKKVTQHNNAKAQVEEWRGLGLVNDGFAIKRIARGQQKIGGKNAANGAHQFLPLDTKHFKDLELEILDGLGDLDAALDGELVHSENWQALNSLRKRYAGKVKCVYIDPPFNLDGSDQFDYRTNYKDSCWATMLENRISVARDFLADNGSIFVRCDNNGNWIVRPVMNGIFGEQNFRNAIVVGKSNRIKTKGGKYLSWYDTVFYYSKNHDKLVFNHLSKKRGVTEWRNMDKPGNVYKVIPADVARMLSPENIKYDADGRPTSRARIILGKEFVPAEGVRYPSQEKIAEMENAGLIRIGASGGPQMKKPDDVYLTDNWTDLFGYAQTTGFQTENSEQLLYRVVKTTGEEGVCFDFFSGSGTTQAVAHKLGRKWLGVEMGEHFNTVVLPRMKNVLARGGGVPGIRKDADYKGGGAFKYYALEQYEETLKNSRHQDGEQLELDSAKSPFEQYVFFADDKLAHAAQPKNGKLEINLKNLYPDIDIAESISNILGKPIRRRTADSVTFTDGTVEKTDPATMTEPEKQRLTALLRPYLWWGE